MALFAITFRIDYDATYDSRYESVVNAIKAESTSTYWDEPTSFFLIESGKSSAGLAESIDAASTLDGRKDLLLVINLSQRGYKPIGNVRDADLHKLMERR